MLIVNADDFGQSRGIMQLPHRIPTAPILRGPLTE
jgi:hypothetical protein